MIHTGSLHAGSRPVGQPAAESRVLSAAIGQRALRGHGECEVCLHH